MGNQEATITSLDHYKALLLLYASHVDLNYSEDERTFIINKVGLPITEETEKFFETKSDFEILAFLVNNRGQFMPDEKGRLEALDLLSSLFKIDGDFSRLEFNSLQFLEKMFYSGSDGNIEL